MKIAFVASQTLLAQDALQQLQARYKAVDPAEADIVVALGGDGLVLRTLYSTMFHGQKVYAMRRTDSVGFLCNRFGLETLEQRLEAAQKVILHPLRTEYTAADGSHTQAVAINEVSILRETQQCAKLCVTVDSVPRIEHYSGDGLLIATPAGSGAYNHSAGGPIIPLDANLLVMTAICGFRPRRWSYALMPQSAVTEIEVLEHEKRPVRIEAGLGSCPNIVYARIWQDRATSFTLLFDPDQHLRERIIREQFSAE